MIYVHMYTANSFTLLLTFRCIGVTDRKKECEPVYQYRFVLNAVEHSPRKHCWEKGVVKVPVGCTCTKQLTSS